jgi:hypothetical protein
MQRENYTPMVPYMPEDPMLYHAYVPYQLDITEFSLEEALNKGTLFKALYSPFAGDLKGDDLPCCRI